MEGLKGKFREKKGIIDKQRNFKWILDSSNSFMNNIISLMMKTHFKRSERNVKATSAAFFIPINIIKPKILRVRCGIAAPATFKISKFS